MKPAFANIRLASNRNDKIDYFCDVAGIEPRILKDLTEYQALEPDADTPRGQRVFPALLPAV